MNTLFQASATDNERQAREALETLASEYRAQLVALQRRRQEIDTEIEKLMQSLKAIDPALIALGSKSVQVSVTMQPGQAIGVAGNRSQDMPSRRSLYRDMVLNDAISMVLAEGRTLHADDIASLIYEARDRDDIRRIKRSLVSSLSRGVEENRWQRVAPNTYKRIESDLLNSHQSEAQRPQGD